LSLPKKFSIKWRHLYISASMGSGCARRGCWEITALAPRALHPFDASDPIFDAYGVSLSVIGGDGLLPFADELTI
jgi:hypothetical protein